MAVPKGPVLDHRAVLRRAELRAGVLLVRALPPGLRRRAAEPVDARRRPRAPSSAAACVTPSVSRRRRRRSPRRPRPRPSSSPAAGALACSRYATTTGSARCGCRRATTHHATRLVVRRERAAAGAVPPASRRAAAVAVEAQRADRHVHRLGEQRVPDQAGVTRRGRPCSSVSPDWLENRETRRVEGAVRAQRHGCAVLPDGVLVRPPAVAGIALVLMHAVHAQAGVERLAEHEDATGPARASARARPSPRPGSRCARRRRSRSPGRRYRSITPDRGDQGQVVEARLVVGNDDRVFGHREQLPLHARRPSSCCRRRQRQR